jgi:Zn-dependent protease
MARAKLNPVVRGMLYGVLLFAGLYASIGIHEFGHFLAAEHLGLNPEMHLFENGSGTGFAFIDQRNYVSYSSPSTELSSTDFLVAIAGPLANFLMAFLLLAAYFKVPKERGALKMSLAMLFIPALLSAIANLAPNPGADGYTVWAYLRL